MQALRSARHLARARLTLPQRVNYLATVLTYFDGWQKAVFYVAPAVVLIDRGHAARANLDGDFLAHFCRSTC